MTSFKTVLSDGAAGQRSSSGEEIRTQWRESGPPPRAVLCFHGGLFAFSGDHLMVVLRSVAAKTLSVSTAWIHFYELYPLEREHATSCDG